MERNNVCPNWKNEREMNECLNGKRWKRSASNEIREENASEATSISHRFAMQWNQLQRIG